MFYAEQICIYIILKYVDQNFNEEASIK